MRFDTGIRAAAAMCLLLAACGSGPAAGSGASVIDDVEDAVDTPEADDTNASADASADADGEVDPEPAEDGAAEEEPEAEESAALGTRDDPLTVGTVIEMGDWRLSVTEITLDATDAVMAENEFNDPPVDGRQFVMFNVDATYAGAESGTAWLDFGWGIVGSAGNTFGGGSMDDYCGVIPTPLDDTGETFPDGTVSGNVCISADTDQLEGATIRIEESFSFDDTRAFFALT
jgi:hypothetical protein